VRFPFEFGFIPSTLGGDGDPLDLLILMDAPTFAGCMVRARLIGVIEAEQSEAGGMERNDRLIAVAVKSRRHEGIRALRQLPRSFVVEIEHFFVSYNMVKGKAFTPCGPVRSSACAEDCA
jgi:inorganic pyrophosphatase